MNNTVGEESWDNIWKDIDRDTQNSEDNPKNGGPISTGVRRRESVLEPTTETVNPQDSPSPVANTVPYMQIVSTSAPAVSRVETLATEQFPQTLQPPAGTVPMTPEDPSRATASGIRRFEIAQAMARLAAQPMLLSGPTPVLGIDRRLLQQISNAPQVDPLSEASEPLSTKIVTRAAIPPPPLPTAALIPEVAKPNTVSMLDGDEIPTLQLVTPTHSALNDQNSNAPSVTPAPVVEIANVVASVKPGTVSILNDTEDFSTLRPVTRSYSEFQAPPPAPPSFFESAFKSLTNTYNSIRDRFRSRVANIFSVKSFHSFLRPTFATLLLAAGFGTLAAHHGHQQQEHAHEATTTVQAPQTVHGSTVQHTATEAHSTTVQETSVHQDTPQVVTSQTVTVSAKHDPHVTFVQAFTKFLTSHGSTPSNYHHHNPDANTMLHQLDHAGQGSLAYQLRHYTHDGDSFSFQRLSNGSIQLTGWHGHHSSYNRVSGPVTFSLPSH